MNDSEGQKTNEGKKLEATKTIPWHDEELVPYRGYLLTYAVNADNHISYVHLPGGKTLDFVSAIRKGAEPPRRVRGIQKRIR